MKRRIRTYSGARTSAESQREIANRRTIRRLAAEGIVLMKNEDSILPIRADQKVALYGDGIAHQIKGGTGSGDVNERSTVTLLEGFLNDHITVINEEAARKAYNDYNEARALWAKAIFDRAMSADGNSDMQFLKILGGSSFVPPAGVPIIAEEAAAADAAVFMISRTAGEGSDRKDEAGDYYLSEKEKSELAQLSAAGARIVVLINSGAQIDLTELNADPNVKAVVFVAQPGMEMGNSIADVLTGAVTPSGKLTDTWTLKYSDFPNADTFSYHDGNCYKEKYTEGIYVGYRYFDSFGIPVVYPFGYGLSYTDFAIKTDKVTVDARTISVTATVTNTGSEFSGKEVVQIYAACPQEGLKKEFKRLIGFGKTALLAPQESQTLTITVPAKTCASFDEAKGAWIVEKGIYGIMVGNSSADAAVEALLEVPADAVIEEVPHICPLQEELDEIERPDEVVDSLRKAMFAEAEAKQLAPITFAPAEEIVIRQKRGEEDTLAQEITEKLTTDELAHLLVGEVTKGQDHLKENELVETGIYVPGAAGETTMMLEEKYDIPAVSMADGPAGLRLIQKYDVDKASGLIYGNGILAAIAKEFVPVYHRENVESYYQFASAIPVGVLLASSWDVSLLEEIGAMIGNEMNEFGVAWWLAPGMNIHRNPLCGRNFEYYSEDPLAAGVIAAAMTNGVQSVPGVGTTIKHFVCNNQEDNRAACDSIVSERALREIYLKGFEIAVKSSQPMCMMTSYNFVNGVHAANCWDTCTECTRNEWGFEGIIMTDWGTTEDRREFPSSTHGCGQAGNDLVEPGQYKDINDYLKALESGEMTREEAAICARRMIRVLLQTNGMENSIPYSSRFELVPYVSCK